VQTLILGGSGLFMVSGLSKSLVPVRGVPIIDRAIATVRSVGPTGIAGTRLPAAAPP
jgi:hypothetical protein